MSLMPKNLQDAIASASRRLRPHVLSARWPAHRRRLRRLTTIAITLGPLLAGITLSTGEASATTPGPYWISNGADSSLCLAPDDSQPYDYGAIIKVTCNGNEDWSFIDTGQNMLGYELYLIESTSVLINRPGGGTARDCVDFHAQQSWNYGSVIQWVCNINDPYQQFAYIGGTLVNAGAAAAFDNEYGAPPCLDGDAQQPYDGGAVIQFQCNDSDSWQQWSLNPA